MFLALVLGRAVDPDALRRQWEVQPPEPGPAAEGWLGSTGGMTADGRVVLVTRFSSAEAAADRSQRPEASEWWSATEARLAAPATVLESDDVGEILSGDWASAGFVQVMRAPVSDRARFEALEAQIGPAFRGMRPDFLAGYRAWFPDGTVAAVDYFSSEAEARAGEAKEMPDQLAVSFQDWLSLVEGAEWYDLVDPWMAVPG